MLNSNGSYTYDLNDALPAVQALDTGETLIETYNYTITDGDGDTSTTTLRITINGANDAPDALNDTNWTIEDGGSVAGNVLQTIAHNGAPDAVARGDVADTDVDVEPLTVTNAGVIAGTYGTLTLNANGTYTYALNNALPAMVAPSSIVQLVSSTAIGASLVPKIVIVSVAPSVAVPSDAV